MTTKKKVAAPEVVPEPPKVAPKVAAKEPLRRPMRRGLGGGPVTEVQAALGKAGFDPGPADGRFGPSTERAVRRFQAAHGIKPTGVVDTATWAAL